MTEDKLKSLCDNMTLDEKLGMIHGNEFFRTKGVDRLGIKPFTFSDGPMGVRQDYEKAKWFPIGSTQDYVSYFPCNTAVAATWNRDIAYQAGKVLGRETRGRGKDMILAPGINIQRTPLCGRNFEYMGEDPCLTAEMVVPMIKGIELNDVSCCVKHFAANSQETERLSIDVIADERTLREIYLPAFRACVKDGKASAIMGAYNKLNGQYCCHNDALLNKILRDDWKFEGVVVSDWGGVHDTEESALNGLDIEMSVTDNFDEYYMANPLKQKVESGEIPEKIIDEKVMHVLHLMDKLNMFSEFRQNGMYLEASDHDSFLQAARESIVLLKNDKHLLPLDSNKYKKILVVGDNANRLQAPGGGSSEIKALYEITPLLGISMLAGGNVTVEYSQGYCAFTTGNIWDASHQEKQESWQAQSLEATADRGNMTEMLTLEELQQNDRLREQAVEEAKHADLVIYVGGLNHEQDTEGRDRKNMTLPYGQDELICQLQQANENMVIVMMSGSPVDMRKWNLKAQTIVQYWYSGMEGGRALAEVLFGKVNPSGRLPETFPICHEDCSAHKIGEFPGDTKVHYTEGIYVGYRYYETQKVPVAYPFGYGLSYTEYKYSNLIVDTDETEGLSVDISVDVENTGLRDNQNNGTDRPVRELRDFLKVMLRAGEKKTLQFKLQAMDFSYFDAQMRSFVAPVGNYTIEICKNASCVELEENITLKENYKLGR